MINNKIGKIINGVIQIGVVEAIQEATLEKVLIATWDKTSDIVAPTTYHIIGRILKSTLTSGIKL